MDEFVIEGRDKLNEYVLAFGQDADNELYVLTSDTQGPQREFGESVQGRAAPGGLIIRRSALSWFGP